MYSDRTCTSWCLSLPLWPTSLSLKRDAIPSVSVCAMETRYVHKYRRNRETVIKYFCYCATLSVTAFEAVR